LAVELHQHQIDAIAKLSSGKVLVGGVGSGKSIASLAYFTAIDPTRKIVVITTAKKRDSGEWFEDAMLMSLRNELVVDSWNNIKKYVDEHAFFIFDEQKIVGKGAWVKAFWSIAENNHWILLSATPADTWMDLMPIFVANGFYKNQTEFNNTHVVWDRFVKYPKVDRYVDEWMLIAHRQAIYVEMPRPVVAERVIHNYIVEYNKEEERRLLQDRWNFYEDQPVKDAGELMRLLRKSTNEDPSRMEQIRKILGKVDRLIIFYNLDYELEILRMLHTELDIPVAEWNGHRHQDIPNSEKWVFLVQYQAGSEGWNCISTNHILFYSLPYSYRWLEQAMGRIDRLNTPFRELHYHILKSRSKFDQGIDKRLRRKKNFNVAAFAKSIWPKADSREEGRMMKPPV
jgi:hypothetical protein